MGKHLLPSETHTLTLAPSLRLTGRYAVVDANDIRGLAPRPKTKGPVAPVSVSPTPLVIAEPDGKYLLLQRPLIVERLLQKVESSRLVVFVVTGIPSETYRQGLMHYMYHVDATGWSSLTPMPGAKKHPAAGGCSRYPAACLEPSCALRAILSDGAIMESLACFALGASRKPSKRELVSLFQGRISISTVDRVRRDLQGKSAAPGTAATTPNAAAGPQAHPSKPRSLNRTKPSDPETVHTGPRQTELFANSEGLPS